MNGSQYIVTSVLLLIVILLYSKKFSPPIVFLIAGTVLVSTGLISTTEVLVGFSNDAIAVMLMLLVISQVIWRTGFIQWIFESVLKPSSNYRGFLAQMMPFVGISSAFMNNTPVVAMMIPFVADWGQRHNVPASKLLMPLSWAAILGGMITLIGTSTNMIVNSLVVSIGAEELSILDFTPVGLMIFVGGMAYVLLIGNRYLPSRKSPSERFTECPREYVANLVVRPKSDLVGRSIAEANLRKLKDLFLVEIIRENTVIAPVTPLEVLEAGDQLVLVGKVSAVADLVSEFKGLASDELSFQSEKLEVIKLVVASRSALIGKKVKETNFRGKYDAAILAVHRHGKHQEGKIGDMKLQSGDLLLVVGGNDFTKSSVSSDFYVISKIKQIHNLDFKKSVSIISSVFLCIMLSIFNVVPLFNSLFVLITGFLVTGILTGSELRKMLNINLLVVAAFALAVGRAVQITGLGEMLANFVVGWLEPFGPIGILAAVYLTTNILAELITTTAAATIVFPFAAASATALGVDGTPFYLAVAYGAAANFITPVGYQTNLMVFGPGGYRMMDFFRAGLPLKLICAIIAIIGLAVTHGLF